MSNLKEQLIRLGSENPELRDHLKPVLNYMNNRKTASGSDLHSYLWKGAVDFSERVFKHLKRNAELPLGFQWGRVERSDDSHVSLHIKGSPSLKIKPDSIGDGKLDFGIYTESNSFITSVKFKASGATTTVENVASNIHYALQTDVDSLSA